MAPGRPIQPFPDPPDGSLPVAGTDGVTAGTLLQGTGEGSKPSGVERRSHFRSPVEAVRSIALMQLDDTGHAAGPWLTADILDVTRRGFCLLLVERPDNHFNPRFRVRLNVSMHPDFGTPELAGSLRWFVRAEYGHVVTLGVRFDAELPRVPALLACRRDQPRVFGQ